MTKAVSSDAVQICEDILRDTIRCNIEQHILPSETAVAERLLSRRLELAGVYAELHKKLGDHPFALTIFLAAVVSTAAFWSPTDVSKAREGRKRLGEVNEEIAFHAAQLAHLIEERDQLNSHSRFASNTHYHVCEIIEAAADDHFLFKTDVRDQLRALYHRYDLKYWPSLTAFIWVIAHDAEAADIGATDPLTAAATSGSRSSRADFLKALYAAIEENSGRNFGSIPSGFRLTDGSVAALATCALDLEPDALIDGGHVKRFRQRGREATKGKRA